MLDEQWQQHIASSVAHWGEMAKESIRQVAQSYDRPSAVFRPRLSVDGDKWCALYGDNLQDGVAGFGDSPADAMFDFDRNWVTNITKQETSKLSDDVLRAHGFPELRRV